MAAQTGDGPRPGGAGRITPWFAAVLGSGCGGQAARKSVAHAGQATVDPTFLFGIARGFWQLGHCSVTGITLLHHG